MKLNKHLWASPLICLALLSFGHPAEAQLFKRLKTEAVGVANQKADQKTVNTTTQSIDQVDNLINKGIKGILNPKKRERKPEEKPAPAAPAVAPATDTTRHRPAPQPLG